MRRHWSEHLSLMSDKPADIYKQRITLLEAPHGKRLKVVRRRGGKGFRANLDGLGIHVGDELVVVKNAPFHGPILVELKDTGAKVAIGRGMAARIEVEPVHEPNSKGRTSTEPEEVREEG